MNQLTLYSIVGFTRIAANFNFRLWFHNFKLTSSFESTTKLMVSAINDEPRGVPLEVSGRMNAQTSRFLQLKVRSDLSNYCALPGQYSFVFTQRLGSAFSMQIVTIVRAKRTLNYFRFERQPDLLVACACNLTVCEPSSLLLGRSFETLTVPNLKFPNYDSACERS